MDLHRLAEERSIAWHRAVAARLAREPALLDTTRARLRGWIDENRSAHYARQWLALVDSPLPTLLAFLVDPSERARALRQATPFAGLIDARERWRIWRAVREELEAGR